jgi:transposase
MASYVQKKTLHASEQPREDVQQARKTWQQALPTMEVEKLVFIDETWTSTGMTRRYGRAPRGQRCLNSAPHAHWETSTIVGALRHCRLVAPLVTGGPLDGEIFLAYVRQFLCPRLEPGGTVILDNLSRHKVAGVEAAILTTGEKVRFLPPFSPDLNPSEKLFAKLKARLRKAAARDIETRWKEIGDLLNTISASECTNYFDSCGYVYT